MNVICFEYFSINRSKLNANFFFPPVNNRFIWTIPVPDIITEYWMHPYPWEINIPKY